MPLTWIWLALSEEEVGEALRGNLGQVHACLGRETHV
jgi:hypothetical protein